MKIKSRILLILILSVFVSGNVYADNENWVKTKGPYGADVTKVFYDTKTQWLFMATKSDGIYRSINDGAYWESFNNGELKSNTWVNDIVIDTLKNNYYCVTETSEICKKTQGGNWSKKKPTAFQNNPSLSSLYLLTGGDLILGTNGQNSIGLWRSTDEALSWNQVTGTNLSADEKIFCLTQAKGGEILVGTDKAIIQGAVNFTGWQVKGNIGATVYCFRKNLKGDTIMAGTAKGAYYSTNNGNDWLPAGAGMAPNAKVISLAYNRNGFFIAGTQDNGVYISNNQLTSWTSYNTGLESNRIQALTCTPQGEVYCGTNFSFYYSKDTKSKWIAKNYNLGNRTVNGFAMLADRGVVLAATDLGVYRTVNNGNSWEQLNQGLNNLYVNALLIAKNGNLLAGTNGDGLYYSTNAGDSWQKLNDPVMNSVSFITTLDTNKNDTTIFAGTRGKGVYSSANDGMGWSQMSGDNYFDTDTILSFVVSDNDYAFAGTSGNGLFRKEPGGYWIRQSGDLSTSISYNALAYYKENINNHFVFVANDYGLNYTATNGAAGYVFLPQDSSGLDGTIIALIVGLNGDVYCSLDNVKKVFVSSSKPDFGKDFKELNEPGLDILVTKSLDISGNGFIFAGTVGGGCYRSKRSTSNDYLNLALDKDTVHVQQLETVDIEVIVRENDENTGPAVSSVDVKVVNELLSTSTLVTDNQGKCSYSFQVPDTTDGLYKVSFLGTKDNYLESAIKEVYIDVQKKKIILDIQPNGKESRIPAQSVDYIIKTKDKYDKPIEYIMVYVDDSLNFKKDSVTTDINGNAVYKLIVPERNDSIYNVTFWAIDSTIRKYQPSDILKRQIQVSHSKNSIYGPSVVCENNTYWYYTEYGTDRTYQWYLEPTNAGIIKTDSKSDSIEVIWGKSGNAMLKLKVDMNIDPDPDTLKLTATINAKDPVTVNNFPAKWCRNDTLDLTSIEVDPKGGTWSGNDVQNDKFIPSKTGFADIFYSVRNTSNCDSVVKSSVEVLAPPTVNLQLNITSACEYDFPITLSGGTPLGGTYSEPGNSNSVIGGQFDPRIAKEGQHTIRYTYTDDSTGCDNYAEQIIDVKNAPQVSLKTGTNTNICSTDSTFNLANIVDDSCTFEGNFVEKDSIFNAKAAGVNNQITIIYTTKDSDPVTGCQGKGSVTLRVVDVPATPTITSNSNKDKFTSSSDTGNQWFRNDTAETINGNSKEFSPIKKGRYHVIVTDPGTECESMHSNYIDFDGISAKGIINIKNYVDALEPGKEYEFPITIKDTGNLKVVGGGITRFTAELKYNGSLLVPDHMEAYKPFWDKVNKQRVLYFDVPISNLANGFSLGTLKFYAAVGSSDTTTMSFDNIKTYNGNLEIDNSFTIETSLITIKVPALGKDGKRLYNVWDESDWPRLMIKPNPSDDDVEISAVKQPDDEFKLELTDLNGQVLKTVFRGKTDSDLYSCFIDTSDLTPGVYFVILQTPWLKTAKQLYIIR